MIYKMLRMRGTHLRAAVPCAGADARTLLGATGHMIHKMLRIRATRDDTRTLLGATGHVIYKILRMRATHLRAAQELMPELPWELQVT